MRSIRWLLLSLLVACVSGCFATPQWVAGADLQPLQAPRQRRPLLLRTVVGKQVRCDPNSYIRFHHRDGLATPWFRAASLQVGPAGARGRYETATWDSIYLAEITNASGSKTFGSLVAQATRTDALEPLLPVAGSPTVPTSPPTSPSSDEEQAQLAPLFSPGQRRQAIARFVLAGAVESDLVARDRFDAALTFSVRFWDLIEVGAGARYLLTQIPVTPQSSWRDQHILGLARAGLHLDLDARRRFAIPFGVELGRGGPVRLQARFSFGLRVRLAGGLFAGAYLWNPAFLRFDSDSPQVAASGWSFLSGLEVGAAF